MLVILIFIVSAAITIIVHKFANTDYVLYKSRSYSLCAIWAIFTSVSVPRMPKTTIFRILFLSWVCHSMILSMIFQSFFTSFLIEPGAGNQISDMEELMSHDLIYFAEEELFHFWFYNTSETIVEDLDKRVNITDNAIDAFLQLRESALFSAEFDVKMRLQSFYARGLRPCDFVQFGLAMYTTNFMPISPYYEAFNISAIQFF